MTRRQLLVLALGSLLLGPRLQDAPPAGGAVSEEELEPLHELEQGKPPPLHGHGIFGTRDEAIPRATVDAFERGLTQVRAFLVRHLRS